MPVAALEGREVPYLLRRSQRARTWRLEVTPGTGLRVILPQRFDAQRIPAILQARRRWILKTLDWASTLPLPLAHDGMGRGQTVSYRGDALALVVNVRPDRPADVTTSDHTLTVSVRRRDGALVRRAIRAWCRRQAQAVIPPRVAALAASRDWRYRSVAIGNQRSRWGSCSRAGRLRFNWRLVLVPPTVLDYVIFHELAHLQVLNHSPAFWRFVASVCPAYEAHRLWLRRHGAQLYF